jgi:hypothetical protein
MPKSYRIRTNVGVDKSVSISIDQEFEYLEILSLKVLQSDIYTRVCSDYGVVIGRVSVNDGFGIPNAKVSIFIPLSNEDAEDPIISQIYPYRTILDVNDDGYRYNLLPYEPSYSAHNPTGTFPSRRDVLTNPTLIEVYDKYYKLNAVTNQSGDFMIFGVPVGAQTLVVDIDLSDIGEFSLSPQDLIRMGIASDSQVSGTNFKTSSNLRELPQIINFTRTVVVEPLWGQSEICNLGITRTDFDLSSESNINIEPTAIFMGSLISTNDNQFQRKNCKPKNKSGQLCDLTTGPGEILAIRQTIFLDVKGRPGLETFELEQGGQVIDENGTWLLDVPMNLDYLITNEFGDQVISDDPKKGIPTRGKYRFKVKWNQSPSLNEPIRRGYYLVPNIKEYGWVDSQSDPRNKQQNSTEYINFVKSYSFSLDWDDYPNIQEAIDCEDRFYMMSYNKVYTVSQLITQYRKGYEPNRIVSIKNIVSDDCSSDTNKFPTNDAVYRFDLIFFLLKILSYVFKPTLIGLVIVAHIVYIAIFILSLIIRFLIFVVGFIVVAICNFVKLIVRVINSIPGVNISAFKDKCPTMKDVSKLANRFKDIAEQFKNIKIPNLSYPDCDVCNCSDPDQVQAESDEETAAVSQQIQNTGGAGAVTNFFDPESYPITGTTILNTQDNYFYQQLYTGLQWIQGDQYTAQLVQSRAPQLITITTPNTGNPPPINLNVTDTFTSSIPIGERLNLFNTKAKYFNGPQDMPSVALTGSGKISDLATPTPGIGNILTVQTISNSYLFVGALLTGSGIAAGTTVLSQISGVPGGIGTYIVSPSQLRSLGSFTVSNFATDSPNSSPLYDNPGGGVNRIKVKVEKTIPTNSGKFHLDNVIALVVKNEALSDLESGQILSFQDSELSMDKNMTGATLNFDSRQSIVGRTLTPLVSGRAKVNNSPTIPTTSGNTLTVIDISYIDNPNVNGLIPNTMIEIEGDVDGLGNQIIRKIVSQNTITPPSNNLPPTPYGLGTYTIDGPVSLIINPNKFVVVTPTTRQLSYADPSGSGVDISVTYDLILKGNPQFPNYDYLKFPMDLEYFQVITGMTYSDYLLLTNQTPNTSVTSWDNLTFNRRFLDNDTMIYNVRGALSNSGLFNKFGGSAVDGNMAYLPKRQYNFNDDFTDLNEQGVIFLVRGADPQSARVNIEYDLSKLFGYYNFGTGPIVSGKFKLNHPIKGGFKTVNHANINFNDDTDSSYSGLKLFYPSFHMTLEPTGSQPEVPPPFQPTSEPGDPPPTLFPNIIIGSGFSAFTSNTISYYSSFDNSTLTSSPLFNPGTGCQYSIPIAFGGYGPSNPIVPPITNGVVSNSKGARLKISTWNPIPTPLLESVSNNRTKGNNGFVVEWKQYATVDGSDCNTSTSFFNDCYLPPSINIFSNGDRYNIESNSFGTNTVKNRGYFETEIVEGSGFMYQDIDMGQSFYNFVGGTLCCRNYSFRKADGFYYAPGYSQANTLVEFRDRTLMVMRSDKLPTSTSLQPNYCNTFPLHNNNNFTIFTFGEDGTTGVVGGLNGSTDISATADLDNGSKRINQVLQSFTCANMAPLPCYQVVQEGPFSGNGLCTSEFRVKEKSDKCWESGPGVSQRGFEGGCYIFVTLPLLSLINGHDLRAIFEWSERLLITFGACRDVISHLFTNNWINGTLYAWSFNNNVTYTSPLIPNGNQPSSQFCKDTLMLHPTNNNFYYRSSPYNDSNDAFVGAERPRVTGLINAGPYSGNRYNLLYPTTIIDLGPRNNYMQEIVMSDEFDGYVANKLGPTSFQDVSDLLNLFLISRLGNLGNFNAIAVLTGKGVQIESFFDRNPETGVLGIGATKMVDGDYAQMIAINSELGVIPFNEINYQDYTAPGIQDPIFITGGGYKSVVFGVFYRANLQLRDFITPKRTIIDGLSSIASQTNGSINCNVNNFPVKSQKVPFYNWEIGLGGPTYCTSTKTIFGSQQNDWYTNPIYANNGGFMAHRYQDLKREDPTSRYFRTEPNTLGLNYYPGFISAVDTSHLQTTPPNVGLPYTNTDGYYNYTADETYWDQRNDVPRAIHTGAPFYFYFGLKKGQTAYDRFSRKWIPTQTILTYE